MLTETKYISDAFEAIHSAALGLHRAGSIDKAVMREFDQLCLVNIPVMNDEDIKRQFPD